MGSCLSPWLGGFNFFSTQLRMRFVAQVVACLQVNQGHPSDLKSTFSAPQVTNTFNGSAYRSFHQSWVNAQSVKAFHRRHCMKTRFLIIASVLCIVPLVPVSAQRSVHLGLSGGLTAALEGSWERGYRGSHAQAALEFAPIDRRIGLRLDAFVHNMTRIPYPGLSRRTNILGATASALVGLGPLHRSLTPYLVAGAGTYRTEYGQLPADWHFGISGGGGVRVQTGPIAVFAEARMHKIADGSTPWLAPVSFGVRF